MKINFKRELKIIGVVVVGSLPLLIYMDKVFNVRMIEDFGFYHAIGFWFCVIFYKEITTKYN